MTVNNETITLSSFIATFFIHLETIRIDPLVSKFRLNEINSNILRVFASNLRRP